MAEQHFTNSSYLEKIIEHKLISEILSSLWLQNVFNAEVLKPDVDGGGYDIVLQVGGIIRHAQLKSKISGGKTSRWKISTNLQQYPAGCVIVIIYNPDTLEIGPFHWFGGNMKEPLPPLENFKTAKHTKGTSQGIKAERAGHKVIGIGKFDTLNSIQELNGKLFGIE